MKILVIGSTGLIGRAVVAELAQRHEVMSVGHNDGDYQVDITQPDSIHQLFEQLKPFDAVVSTTGKVKFAPLAELDTESLQFGLNNKLMGQVNLVQIGTQYINDGGSFTLTSGILNIDPIVAGASAAMVNGGVDSFAKAAAIELPRGIRINVVSPTVIAEAMENYAPFFRGYEPVPVATAALAYSKSVEGRQTGQIYRVGY